MEQIDFEGKKHPELARQSQLLEVLEEVNSENGQEFNQKELMLKKMRNKKMFEETVISRCTNKS